MKETMTGRPSCILVTVVGIVDLAASGASADVDLVWSPETRVVLLGTILEIDLYAVTDNGQDQTIAAMDVVLTWDPERVVLIGVVDNGPYEWLESGFNIFGLLDFDRLNESLLDGDAKYTALGILGDPAIATREGPPEGLLVTTFLFFAVAEAEPTEIVIEESLSTTAVTRVFGGDQPNQIITGELNTASVAIIRRPKVPRPRPPAAALTGPSVSPTAKAMGHPHRRSEAEPR